MKWENVYVFISSTFNDMHAERDYLVKSVFPILSEWCEARKLRLIDIDLRWGVTAADSEAKNTVRACLRNIDECRPFFLCFLGQRRGWVPSADDIGKDTYELFPRLMDSHYIGETSVTEMEILHALVDPLHNGILRGTRDDSRTGEAMKYAFFYLRQPDYLNDIKNPDQRAIYTNEAESNIDKADSELARWRNQEIPRTGRPIYDYEAEWMEQESTPEIALPLFVPTTAPKDSEVWKNAFRIWKARWEAAGVRIDDSGEISGPELEKAKSYNMGLTSGRLGNFNADGRPLAEVVVTQLQQAIAEHFPAHMTIEEQAPLQKELDQQAQFLHIAEEGFIERLGDLDAIYEYLQSGERRPFALTAYAGMGKTSLLAHFIDTYSTREGESLHYRFIGGSNDSVNVKRLFHSLLWEMKEAGKIESDIPDAFDEMMDALPDLLAEAGQKGRTILVIDALNQLESAMSDLYWIPAILPENVKLIVSFKVGEKAADEYYSRQKEMDAMLMHEVKPFDSADDRKAMVASYLERYFKELDEPRIQALISSDGAGNPLFLKIALSELRVFGVHNDLSEVIRTRFGNTPVMSFEAVLVRLESDPAYTKLTPAVVLPHVFGWIAHSRYGLGVDELCDLLMREGIAGNKTDAQDAVHLILRQLRAFLAKRDGRVDFFYESLKIAAMNRYTSNHPYARESKAWHQSLALYFETLPLENHHKLMEQAWQYLRAGMGDSLQTLFWNYPYMVARSSEFGIDELIEDYNYVSVQELDIPEEAAHALVLLQKCMILSAPALRVDANRLPRDLFARMVDMDNPMIQTFLKHVLDSIKTPWFRALHAYLDAPQIDLELLTGKSTVLSGDGRIAVAKSDDNKKILEIWDVKKRRIIKRLPEFAGAPFPIAISVDGSLLVVKHYKIAETLCARDEQIEVWDTGKGVLLYSPQAITGTPDMPPPLAEKKGWIDPPLAQPVRYFANEVWNEIRHEIRIDDALITADDRFLIVTAGMEQKYYIGDTQTNDGIDMKANRISVWDLRTGAPVNHFGNPDEKVICCSVCSAGFIETIATAGEDTYLRVWDMKTGDCIFHTKYISNCCHAAIGVAGDMVVMPSWPENISMRPLQNERHFDFIDTKSGKRLFSLDEANTYEENEDLWSYVNWFGISKDGRYFYVHYDYFYEGDDFFVMSDKKIEWSEIDIYDLAERKIIGNVGNIYHPSDNWTIDFTGGRASKLFFSDDSTIVAAEYAVYSVNYLLNKKKERMPAYISVHEKPKNQELTPEAKLAISEESDIGGTEYYTDLMDMRRGVQMKRVVRKDNAGLRAVNAQNDMLAFAEAALSKYDKRCCISLYDLRTDTIVSSLDHSKNKHIAALCFTPDGNFLMALTQNNVLKFWQLKKAEGTCRFTKHKKTLKLGNEKASESYNSNLGFMRIEIIENGKTALAVLSNGNTVIVDMKSHKVIRSDLKVLPKAGGVVSSDGRFQVHIGKQFELVLYDNEKQVELYKNNPEELYCKKVSTIPEEGIAAIDGKVILKIENI